MERLSGAALQDLESGVEGSGIGDGQAGGAGGGKVVAVGTPEQVAANTDSLTGKYLKKYLDKPKNRK